MLGVFLANLYSPYLGLWELGWMPLVNLLGAILCRQLARVNKWAGAALYALAVAAGVGVMLAFILKLSFWAAFPPVLASETVLIVGGVPIMERILGKRDEGRGTRGGAKTDGPSAHGGISGTPISSS